MKRRWHKTGVRTAGVLFLAALSAFVLLTVKIYNKDFITTVPVTLQADRVGNQLRAGGQVKARGVVVGEIRGVRAIRGGAEISLALEPEQVKWLPVNVSALLVPKTLFGERYVQLSIPDTGRKRPLRAGDVISQDRSANAIELERVFDNLLPVLKAVQPQKLSTTLTAVSTALQGRGAQLGQTLATASDYLRRFNPNLPQLDQNVRDLATVTQMYGDIAPDLLDALTDSSVTLGTINAKRTDLGSLYQQVTTSSRDLTTFLRQNRHNIIALSADSRRPLEIGAKYSPSFPCTLQALTDLKPSMDKVLGAGTKEPGLHVEVTVSTSRGKYVPGKDDPAYTGKTGPRCYPSGVTPAAGTPASVPSTGDLGIANSPQEQQFLAPLLAPSLGVSTADVPMWSSVLVGPLYRGTEVTAK
ncbi:MCE family protein [Amycolatopsis rubida]|uniref:MCE family protein n=1 Tax=Amycolatopsis rubida TaxID=112413 RepID=A0ABX0BY97_9PSEU|nr:MULTISPECIES: MCE family protein [Amycolatopsis]MYW95588.1 MCE family protein [Amycolatopsis rubida]NEC60577.1 MCE family protein [Amycolatopsis rubida]OAP22481.1 mce related protein [Amycolatopsis sp. M39]